eukprot:3807909-Pyramimonas_sp.AAC.1
MAAQRLQNRARDADAAQCESGGHGVISLSLLVVPLLLRDTCRPTRAREQCAEKSSSSAWATSSN